MTLAAAAVLGLALAGWAFVFVPERTGIWRRSRITAGVLTGASILALRRSGELSDAVGGVSLPAVVAGLAVGGAWLVATHAGHWVLCRVIPSFVDQVRDLYSIAAGDRRSDVLVALVAMAVAEEFVFRLVAQRTFGLVIAVAAYTIVQGVERNWALMVAAVAGGTVWGLLYGWQDALVSPLIAHVIWTGALTFVWPLRGCGDVAVPEAAGIAIVDRD